MILGVRTGTLVGHFSVSYRLIMGVFQLCSLPLVFSDLETTISSTPGLRTVGDIMVRSKKLWSFLSVAKHISYTHSSLERASHMSKCDGNGQSYMQSSNKEHLWQGNPLKDMQLRRWAHYGRDHRLLKGAPRDSSQLSTNRTFRNNQNILNHWCSIAQ